MSEIKIYVIHSPKNEYRKKRIDTLLNKYNLKFEYVSEGSPDLWSETTLTDYFQDSAIQNIGKNALSCALNHIFCYERIIKENVKYAIIFEDDIFILKNFEKILSNVIKELPMLDPSFIISLENSTLKFPSIKEIKKGQILYKKNYGRCAAAYIVDINAAKNILNNLKVSTAIDHWHNELIEKNILQMYWLHTPIIEQGSFNGYLSSSTSTNNRTLGLQRIISWKLQKFYKYYVYRFFKYIIKYGN